MPEPLKRACRVFGCGQTEPCAQHARLLVRDQRSAFARGYDKRWQRTSQRHLRSYPLCGDRPAAAPETADSRCRAEGRISAARVTDHIVPHRGNATLLWAESNRQSLCLSCHGVKSQREGQPPRG